MPAPARCGHAAFAATLQHRLAEAAKLRRSHPLEIVGYEGEDVDVVVKRNTVTPVPQIRLIAAVATHAEVQCFKPWPRGGEQRAPVLSVVDAPAERE